MCLRHAQTPCPREMFMTGGYSVHPVLAGSHNANRFIFHSRVENPGYSQVTSYSVALLDLQRTLVFRNRIFLVSETSPSKDP